MSSPLVMSSSVLIFGTERSPSHSIESDFSLNLQDGLKKLSQVKYDVICLPLSMAMDKTFIQFWDQQALEQKSVLVIEIPPDQLHRPSLEPIQKLIEIYQRFFITENYLAIDFEEDLWKAIDFAQKRKQDQQLETIVQEQKEKLKNLYNELETRVEKRQRFLLEAIHRTEMLKNRWALLNEALYLIYKANTLTELEKFLQQFLQQHFHAQSVYFEGPWFATKRPEDSPLETSLANNANSATYYKTISTKILLELNHPNLHLHQQDHPQLQQSTYQQQHHYLVIQRYEEQNFSKEEIDFFQQLSEALVLTMERIHNQELSETIRLQWQTTFNSISTPLALISDEYQVLQANQNFLNGKEVGGKCYQLLFHRKTPCPGCHLGKSSIVQNEALRSYQVHSQELHFQSEKRHVYFHLYKDITEEKKIESKLIESAKMAELGTIGSSIAHELNNPLGGILSFVQLIKMDLPKDSPFLLDMLEMEKAVHRSKDIIQNLLQFTRSPEFSAKDDFFLNEILLKAIQLQQLQLKTKNIQLNIQNPMPHCPMTGNASLILQSLQNILYLWFESIAENLIPSVDKRNSAEISILETPSSYEIHLLDNSTVANELQSPLWASVSLDLTKKIIFEHGGKLDFMRDSGPFHGVKITFSRPVFR